LFRYEKETNRFFRKFYNKVPEDEVPYDDKLLHDATLSGVLTTAERYNSGGAPVADPAAGSFSRMAVKYQRTRPYWQSVMYLNDYTRDGTIEIGADGRLEVVRAVESIKALLEQAVSDINARPSLSVSFGDEKSITVGKQSGDFDFGLRLELKQRELTVISESSYYEGRSSR